MIRGGQQASAGPASRQPFRTYHEALRHHPNGGTRCWRGHRAPSHPPIRRGRTDASRKPAAARRAPITIAGTCAQFPAGIRESENIAFPECRTRLERWISARIVGEPRTGPSVGPAPEPACRNRVACFNPLAWTQTTARSCPRFVNAAGAQRHAASIPGQQGREEGSAVTTQGDTIWMQPR